MSWQGVHRIVVYLCVCVNVCGEFKSCILEASVFQTKDAQQDNCFLSKRTNTENDSWISDYHVLRRKTKKCVNSPRILIWKCFMVARLHDWNGFSAQNCLFTVNYKGYWYYGRCQDCHYIFRSHPALYCMKMINDCLLTAVYAWKSRAKKSFLHSLRLWKHFLNACRVPQATSCCTAICIFICFLWELYASWVVDGSHVDIIEVYCI